MFWIYSPTPGTLTGPHEDLKEATRLATAHSFEEELDVYVVELDENDNVVEGYYTNMLGEIVNEDQFNGINRSNLN